MRDILFRGKTLSGKWVEGAYYKQELFYGDKEDAHIIITSKETLDNDFALERYIVIPETVGQYTGLTDKNGKKIFEGDIIHSFYANCPKNEHIEKVSFFDGTFSAEGTRGGFYSRLSGQGSPKHIPWDKSVYMIECEVIGNLHDNPELLKEGEA